MKLSSREDIIKWQFRKQFKEKDYEWKVICVQGGGGGGNTSQTPLYTPLSESIDPLDYEWRVICVQGGGGGGNTSQTPLYTPLP